MTNWVTDEFCILVERRNAACLSVLAQQGKQGEEASVQGLLQEQDHWGDHRGQRLMEVCQRDHRSWIRIIRTAVPGQQCE